MARSAKKPANRRGAPEAIAKRRAARALNQIFDGSRAETKMDGRTLKRKQRLLDELKNGKKGQPLKALEALAHASELFALGESLSSLRKLKPKIPSSPSMGPEETAIVRQTQQAYSFDSRAWKLIGVDIEKVMASEGAKPAARARAKGTKPTRKKSTGKSRTS